MSKAAKVVVTILVAAVLLLPAAVLLLMALLWRAFDTFHRNRRKVAEVAQDAAKVSRVAAGLAALWVWLTAPTGLATAAASVGIVATPVVTPAVVLLAPFLAAAVAATHAVSAALDLYAKWSGDEEDG